MQVAKVLAVSELANSEKLYKLSIDVGNGETKQVAPNGRCQNLCDSWVPVRGFHDPQRMFGSESPSGLVGLRRPEAVHCKGEAARLPRDRCPEPQAGKTGGRVE